ncbi:MAG: tetratricopeptide repeat protein [Elusimicrobia bacterium]|nr:tetratricopeptide repeat protein [Elusimicrobiota bacterium]
MRRELPLIAASLLLIVRLGAAAPAQPTAKAKAEALADLEKGRKASGAGDYQGAIKSLSAAAAKDPSNAEAQFLLGFAYSHAKRMDDAIRHTRAAVKLSPRDANARYNLAYFLQTSGKKDESVKAYLDTLKLAPDHAGAHFNLGILLTEKKDPTGPFHCKRAAQLNATLSGPICKQ